MSSGVLIGREAIADYTGRHWSVIKRWIDNDNFPAVKRDGRWESHKELIDKYRLRYIETHTAGGRQCQDRQR